MLKYIIFILSETYYNSVICQKQLLEENVKSHGGQLHLISCPGVRFSDGSDTVPSDIFMHLLPEWAVPNISDTLFITDTPKLFCQLQNTSCYAIALYHEHNRNHSFPGALYAVEDIFQLEYRSYDEAYRRLAGIPWDILETERLFVRESTLPDIPSFYRVYQDSSITAHMEPLYADPREETIYLQDYIKQVYGFYGFGIWTVLLKETGQIIGRAGLNVREGYDLPELGFVIDAAHQRQGLGYEVCRAILDYAREELEFQKVQAFVQEENISSRKLLKKLGFFCERQVQERGCDYLLYTCQLSFAYEKEV